MIVFLLALLTCLDKTKLMCPFDLIGDMSTSIRGRWVRKLDEIPNSDIMKENLEYIRKL